MRSFVTTFSVEQSPQEVFDAINDVRSWWQGEIEGNTNKLHEEFTYRMEDIHFSRQRIVEFTPNEKVSWLVTDSQLSFTATQNEWTGTTICFEISRVDGRTHLCFTHEGLVPEFECFNDCSNAWGLLVGQSLFSRITEGKGTKVFGAN